MKAMFPPRPVARQLVRLRLDPLINRTSSRSKVTTAGSDGRLMAEVMAHARKQRLRQRDTHRKRPCWLASA